MFFLMEYSRQNYGKKDRQIRQQTEKPKKRSDALLFFSTIMFFLYLFFYNFVGGYNSDGIWQGSPKIEGQYEVKKQLKVSDRFIEKTLEMAKSYR